MKHGKMFYLSMILATAAMVLASFSTATADPAKYAKLKPMTLLYPHTSPKTEANALMADLIKKYAEAETGGTARHRAGDGAAAPGRQRQYQLGAGLLDGGLHTRSLGLRHALHVLHL